MLYGEFFMLDYLREYIKENIKIISVLFLCVIIGLVVGMLVYKIIPGNSNIELINTLKNTLEYTKQEDFVGINVIKNGVISNSILVAIIYFSSITLIAPFIVCIMSFVKGFAIGLYIPTIFYVFGFGNGILVLLLLVVIPNLVYLPAYIYLSINSLKFHYELFEIKEEGKIGLTLREILKIVIGFSVIILSVILEQLLSYGVIKIYINM